MSQVFGMLAVLWWQQRCAEVPWACSICLGTSTWRAERSRWGSTCCWWTLLHAAKMSPYTRSSTWRTLWGVQFVRICLKDVTTHTPGKNIHLGKELVMFHITDNLEDWVSDRWTWAQYECNCLEVIWRKMKCACLGSSRSRSSLYEMEFGEEALLKIIVRAVSCRSRTGFFI